MGDMRMMTLVEQFSFMFKVLLTLLTMMILIALFVSTTSIIDTKYLVRINSEIMDNILGSSLTKERAVFDSTELDRLNGLQVEKPVRHCSIAYSMLVETQDNKWEFGYKYAALGTMSVTQNHPAAVLKDNQLLPAKVSLAIEGGWLPAVSCAIEKAYRLGEPQTLEFSTCFNLYGKDGQGPPNVQDCSFSVFQQEDNGNSFICTRGQPSSYSQTPLTCRYLPGVKFDDIFSVYKLNNKKTFTLTAFPIRAGESSDCNILRGKPYPIPKDEVSTVVICI